MSQSDVPRIWSKFIKTHYVADRHRRDRSCATIRRHVRYLKLTARKHQYRRANELRRDLQAATQPTVLNQTIWNLFHEVGLRSRRTIRPPVLTRRHRIPRMRWARLLQNWMREQWDLTFFCDETLMSLYPDDRSVRARRRSGERMNNQFIREGHAYGGRSASFWSVIMYGRLMALVYVR